MTEFNQHDFAIYVDGKNMTDMYDIVIDQNGMIHATYKGNIREVKLYEKQK